MKGRIGLALLWHEFVERTRDRWVLVISVLFALLAVGTSLYGRGAEADVQMLTGPSLVTLATLFVPLTGAVLGHDAIVGERERNTLGLLLSLPASRLEILAAKFVGRLLALALAVGLGLGLAALVAGGDHAPILMQLFVPTLILGAVFLSLGLLISTFSRRQTTAASLVVALWFLLVFFYDLGLLGLLVFTDGAVSTETISRMVFGNPAGLYRLEMMELFAGPELVDDLGVAVELPGTFVRAALWTAWTAIPLALSALILTRRRTQR